MITLKSDRNLLVPGIPGFYGVEVTDDPYIGSNVELYDTTIYKAEVLQQESIIFSENLSNSFYFEYNAVLKGKWRYTLRACRDTAYLGYYDCEDGVDFYLNLLDPCDVDPNTINTDVYNFDTEYFNTVCGFDPFCSEV